MRVLVMVCVAVLLAGCGKKATSTGAPARAVTHKPALSTAKAVGQTLIASYPSAAPPPALLSAIRAGHVGGVIMMGANTPSISTARAAADKLQAAAKAGHNPPLLIMTDQEGGEIERLQGQPPVASAAQMGTESAAAVKRLGERTGAVLRRAGINMDLAPDADVARVPSGFIATEKRSFGTTPAVAARGACSFAAGLSAARIGYT
ncbi:MAG: hypothetical protein J2O48_08335, partial [Solirubrobacterales bacterium]|nr:hypothetical protein [Solirubrobacterales bacterium]